MKFASYATTPSTRRRKRLRDHHLPLRFFQRLFFSGEPSDFGVDLVARGFAEFGDAGVNRGEPFPFAAGEDRNLGRPQRRQRVVGLSAQVPLVVNVGKERRQ